MDTKITEGMAARSIEVAKIRNGLQENIGLSLPKNWELIITVETSYTLVTLFDESHRIVFWARATKDHLGRNLEGCVADALEHVPTEETLNEADEETIKADEEADANFDPSLYDKPLT